MNGRKTFYFFFILTTSLSGLLFSASEPSPEIEAIDNELHLLIEKQHKLRGDAMRTEIDGQHLMFEEWSEYAGQIKKVENFDEAIDAVQQKIDALNLQRTELLQKQSKKL